MKKRQYKFEEVPHEGEIDTNKNGWHEEGGFTLHYKDGVVHRESGPAYYNDKAEGLVWKGHILLTIMKHQKCLLKEWYERVEELYNMQLKQEGNFPTNNVPGGDIWFLKDGLIHREDGPAIIENPRKDYFSRLHYLINEKPVGEDKPSVVTYYQNQKGEFIEVEDYITEEGVIVKSTRKHNGVLHCLDHPAVEYGGMWHTRKFYDEDKHTTAFKQEEGTEQYWEYGVLTKEIKYNNCGNIISQNNYEPKRNTRP